MVLNDVSRKQAFLTHLAASGTVFIVLSYYIVFHWYPDFYFSLDGGSRAIGTIFFVDIVLGPGMTLLVFKPGKKHLKFDITMILVLQLAALVWGVSNVYTERPATAVFYHGGFTCVSQPDAGDYDMQSITSGPSGRQRLSFLQRPDSVDKLLDFSKEAYAHHSSSIYYYGKKIVPLDQHVVARLDKYKLDLTTLGMENADLAAAAEDIRKKRYSGSRYQLLPISCRYANAVAVYDKSTFKVIDTLKTTSLLTEAEAIDEPLPLSIDREHVSIQQIQDGTPSTITGK